MDKIIKTLAGFKPNQILMYGGMGMAFLGAVGTFGGVSIVPGNELYIVLVGCAFTLTGAYLAFVKAARENQAKQELKGKKK